MVKSCFYYQMCQELFSDQQKESVAISETGNFPHIVGCVWISELYRFLIIIQMHWVLCFSLVFCKIDHVHPKVLEVHHVHQTSWDWEYCRQMLVCGTTIARSRSSLVTETGKHVFLLVETMVSEVDSSKNYMLVVCVTIDSGSTACDCDHFY
mgnify:CR=1 FL=1